MNAMDLFFSTFPVFSVGKTSTVVNKTKKQTNKNNIIFVFTFSLFKFHFSKRGKKFRAIDYIYQKR